MKKLLVTTLFFLIFGTILSSVTFPTTTRAYFSPGCWVTACPDTSSTSSNGSTPGACATMVNGVCQSSVTTPGAVTVQPTTSSGPTGCVDDMDGKTLVAPDASGKCLPGTSSVVNGVSSPQASINLNYYPLEPLPFVNGYQTGQVSFCALLNGLFRLLIFIGGLLAVGSFVYAGVMYMTSEVVGIKSKAKEGVQAAVWGLLILLASWIILNTINPQLLTCNQALNPVISGSTITTVGQTQQNQYIQDANTCAKNSGGKGVFQVADPGSTPLKCPTATYSASTNCAQLQSGVCMTSTSDQFNPNYSDPTKTLN